MSPAKRVLCYLLAVMMVAVGVTHFTNPAPFVDIMPGYLPWHLELVYLSGVFEILGGVGLVLPATRRAAAWGLIALFVCVFPANVHHAMHHVPAGGVVLPPAYLWGRLQLQAVLIAWAYWMTRPSEPRARA